MTAIRLLLLVAAALVFAQINEWRLLDQLVIAIVAILSLAFLWSRASLRGLVAARRIENSHDRRQVGQTLVEHISLENRSRIGKLWTEVHDSSTLPGHDASRVVSLRGRGQRSWTVSTVCAKRGRYRTGPLVLRGGDPFGIFPALKTMAVQLDLLVYPAALDLSGFALPAGLLSGGAAAERRTPLLTPSVAGIRDYVPGDAFNRISWTATARLNRLMVKEFDIDPTSDLWIVLDLERAANRHASRPRSGTEIDPERLPVEAWLDATEEYGITVAASLTRLGLDQGRAVGIVATAAHHEVLPAERSDRQYVKILEMLSVIQADGRQPLAEALVAEGRRFSRHSGLIVITASSSEAWVQALVEIASRRVKAMAVVIAADSFGEAPSPTPLVEHLHSARVPVHVVRFGQSIAAALAYSTDALATGRNARG